MYQITDIHSISYDINWTYALQSKQYHTIILPPTNLNVILVYWESSMFTFNRLTNILLIVSDSSEKTTVFHFFADKLETTVNFSILLYSKLLCFNFSRNKRFLRGPLAFAQWLTVIELISNFRLLTTSR